MLQSTVTPDLSTGLNTRTVYDSTSKTIKLTPPTLVTSFLGDTSVWLQNGNSGAYSVNGDKVTISSANGDSNYLSLTTNLNQTTATPLTVRVKAQGSNITGTQYYGNYGMEVIACYTTNALSGTHDTVSVAFPVGTWDEMEFSINIPAPQPILWLYVYIFAENNSGTLTVWDGEIFPQTGTATNYGTWESNITDLYSQLNQQVLGNSINVSKLCFAYGNYLKNVDGIGSVEHSISKLSDYNYIVTGYQNDSAEQEVVNALVAKGVKFFGYVQLGWSSGSTPPTDAQMKSNIDSVASAGYYGVFFDMAGYDWNVTRDYFNTYVDYAHSKNLKVMANAWNPPDVLVSTVDATYNPNGVATHLTTGDWVLLESFFARGDNTYAGTDSASWSSALNKYTGAVSMAHAIGVDVGCLAYINSTKTVSQNSNDNVTSYVLAVMTGVDAWSYGSTSDTYTLSEFPTIQLGNKVTSGMSLVSSTRWQVQTDIGAIYFDITNESAPTCGAFSTVDNLNFIKGSLYASSFNAGSIYVTWYTSNDKQNWSEWVDEKFPSRYVKVQVGVYS